MRRRRLEGQAVAEVRCSKTIVSLRRRSQCIYDSARGAGRKTWLLSMRRAQAILVILSLLAVPLALVTCVNSCDQIVCGCCATMSHGKSMNCRSGMSGKCSMSGRGQEQQLPDFVLAAHQSRTAPLPFVRLAEPSSLRFAIADSAPSLAVGFSSAPFEPPRS